MSFVWFVCFVGFKMKMEMKNWESKTFILGI